MNPSTSDVLVALRKKFPTQEYAFLTEVPNATGYSKSRSADAMVMSLWPSRGLALSGFEIKSQRNDWIKELRNPAKAEAICRYCDFWYVAVASEDIVKIEELPSPWGLMVLKKSKLVVAKEAVKIQAAPMDREFLAAILRRASEQLISKDENTAALSARYQEGIQYGKSMAIHPDAFLASENQSFKAGIAAFETSSGIEFNHYDMGKIGSIVKILRNQTENNQDLKWLKKNIEDEIQSMDSTRQALKLAVDECSKLEHVKKEILKEK